jgi:carbohydrate-selective porin OprB
VAPGSNRGMDLTFGVNAGPQHKSEVPTEFTGGLIFNGPIKARPKDGLALGFVFSKIGTDFNRFQNSKSLVGLNNETLIELNYKIQVFPWFTLQPVYQHYTNVGGSKNTAANAGFRLMTTF